MSSILYFVCLFDLSDSVKTFLQFSIEFEKNKAAGLSNQKPLFI